MTQTPKLVSFDATEGDLTMLPAVVEAACAAGSRLLAVFSRDARPRGRHDMVTAAKRNEEVSLDGLRNVLAGLRPGARWVDDEQETTVLPAGEWWTVDAVEG